ncbi:MAG: M48 family metallopeptidase [Aestuariivirga sp.]
MRGVARFLKNLVRPEPLAPMVINASGTSLPVVFRKNANARRLVLRFSRDMSEVRVTIPHRVSRNDAMAFVNKSQGWIEKQLAKTEAQRDDPSRILFRGEEYELVYTGELRGLIWIDQLQARILVPGDKAHAPRRLADWMAREAKRELTEASHRRAAEMGVKVSRVSVRDQKSRWGSCSSSGDLSYSWRLIMAPPQVLDYVVVHEAAHLRHMNHGAAYWRLVLKHCPDAAEAKDWLKANGGKLHRML